MVLPPDPRTSIEDEGMQSENESNPQNMLTYV
jgi:hypothetical protein